MPLDYELIIWDTVITGAVNREGIALLLSDLAEARSEVMDLFHNPDYKPESNEQAMSDISRWARDAVAKFSKIELLPMERERMPMTPRKAA